MSRWNPQNKVEELEMRLDQLRPDAPVSAMAAIVASGVMGNAAGKAADVAKRSVEVAMAILAECELRASSIRDELVELKKKEMP